MERFERAKEREDMNIYAVLAIFVFAFIYWLLNMAYWSAKWDDGDSFKSDFLKVEYKVKLRPRLFYFWFRNVKIYPRREMLRGYNIFWDRKRWGYHDVRPDIDYVSLNYDNGWLIDRLRYIAEDDLFVGVLWIKVWKIRTPVMFFTLHSSHWNKP